MYNEYTYTTEDLLLLPETQVILNNYSDEWGIQHKIKYDLAKSKNYRTNVYYHATGSMGEIGLGKGLYLGKDRKALSNFYNGDGTRGKIETYKGKLKFIDLTLSNLFDAFERNAIKQYGRDRDKEYLKKHTLKLKYDGIRYYDPIATGEEFILYNTSKATKCKNG